MKRWTPKQLGGAALASWLVHAIVLLRAGLPYDLFWAGNVAVLLIGAGLLLRKASPTAVGVLWLSLAAPLWMLEAALGGVFMPSTAAAYVAGAIAGVAGLRALKLPARSWKTAAIALLALQQFCRFTTPVRDNINFCVLIWYGWEGIFKTYPAFWICLSLLAAASFAATAAALRRLSPASAA